MIKSYQILSLSKGRCPCVVAFGLGDLGSNPYFYLFTTHAPPSTNTAVAGSPTRIKIL